jgi:tRNA (Thr-GGU) A37 N-methylase
MKSARSDGFESMLGIEDTVIEIDSIDAFADTPVLDLKP